MALEELNTRIPEIGPEEQPDIMAYSLLRNFVADLMPRETTAGMQMWSEFRYRATRETNHARWSRTFEISGHPHTVALFAVHGELPGGKPYAHRALRCSCCLPDYKSYKDLEEEYNECPAQNQVIARRTVVYRAIVGHNQLGTLGKTSLAKATAFLLDYIQREPMAFPPSYRSDRLLINPLADVFGVPNQQMLQIAEGLSEDNVAQLFGESHLSLSIAA